MSVVFNSFKDRFVNGQVPKEDTWTFVPVNKEFTANFGNGDYQVEQFRSVEDFQRHNSSAWDASKFQGIRTDYEWFKPHETTGTSKPMFITSGVYNIDGSQISASNWDDFKTTDFYKDVSGNSAINDYLASGGFYYILKKDELRWFADRVNSGNNRIIGVLGDGIDGVISGQIGKNEDFQFQGVLDGNGHALENVTVMCDNDDNGIVGVLGQDGVVKNFKITNTEDALSLVCKKQININHIKKDGRDVNAALLVGRNYGRIENIDAHELASFRFSGFVPQVYSVTNKSDDYEDFSTIRSKYDQGENFYFLNSWCINSPGNVCPYVGYFAEGLFAQSARGYVSGGTTAKECIEFVPALKSKYNPGICDTTLELESKCSLVAFFVKAAGLNTQGNNGIYVKPGDTEAQTAARKACLTKSLYTQEADGKWGTNCVFFIAFDTTDELGAKTRYFLELNGTAYDKKSGSGKRRYYFHCGHYNYLNHIQSVEFDEDESLPERINEYYQQITETGTEAGTYIKAIATFDNGSDESEDEDDVENGSEDSDFEIADSDIKVYTSDGIPAKIVDKDITRMFYAPRNLDVSSAVWDKIQWVCTMKNGTVKLTTSFQSSGDGVVYVDITFDNPIEHDVKYGKDGTWWHVRGQDIEGYTDAATYIQNWQRITDPAWNENDTGMPRTIAQNSLEVISETEKYLHAQYRFYKAGDNVEEDGYPADLNENKTWSVADQGNIKAAAAAAVAAEFSSDDSDYTNWTYASWLQTGPKHYATNIIVDDQDKTRFAEYFANRTDTWNDDYTYNGLHKYDILINHDDGIRAEGTIDMTLLRMQDFQYRPFVHASISDMTAANLSAESAVRIFPGARLGDMTDYLYSANGGDKSAISAQVSDYLAEKANAFILNPTYYGLDLYGSWTTMCVRPDPEDRAWDARSAADERWPSTLHFNWNLIRRMFDTDNEYKSNFRHYEELNDPEPWNLEKSLGDFGIAANLDFADAWYEESDIGHAMLNKSVKMTNMARAAYYISPIVGSNFGRIQNVVVSADRKNEGNFVGFIGSIAGKQERGVVDHCSVYTKDKFNYYEAEPVMPNSAYLDDAAYESALSAYNDATANYNYRVRYKATPIMPNVVSEAVDTLTDNPDDDWEKYQYYPSDAETRFDESVLNDSAHSNISAKIEYLSECGVTAYVSAESTESAGLEVYTKNPDYIFDKGFYDASAPVRAYTSAWFDDYDTTATSLMNDTVTYNLRPIFNAGGLFGKIVPTYNESNIELSGGIVSGTVCSNLNVHYILEDSVPEDSIKDAATLSANAKDIHNAFGAIAGLVELETAEVCQNTKGSRNAVNLEYINVSAETNTHDKVLPFGFFSYQPNEIPTIATDEAAPRKKGGVHEGEYTNTMYAFDYPITIGHDVAKSLTRLNKASYGNSSAAFFAMTKSDYDGLQENGHLSGNKTTTYFQHLVNAVFNPGIGVNVNTSAMTYCNPSALDIHWDSEGPFSIDSLFGSNVTFIPSMPTEMENTNGGYVREQLESYSSTRSYIIGHTPLTASNVTVITNFTPINIDCLSNADIFNKGRITDIYFDYTYSSVSSFVPDLSFQHDVIFTSALPDTLAEAGVKSSDTNVKLGYVFRDELSHSGDGFQYKNNFLHLGDSVCPKYIRQTLANSARLFTSGIAGYYIDDNGELVSATNNHVYDGMLVLDSQDRTVMYIDNSQGADVTGGSLNIACSSVYFGDTNGGMILEVK